MLRARARRRAGVAHELHQGRPGRRAQHDPVAGARERVQAQGPLVEGVGGRQIGHGQRHRAHRGLGVDGAPAGAVVVGCSGLLIAFHQLSDALQKRQFHLLAAQAYRENVLLAAGSGRGERNLLDHRGGDVHRGGH